MSTLKNKRHIFFDLDDTLWDFQKNSAIVLEQLFAEFSLRQKLNTDFDHFLITYKQINLNFWSLYYKKQIDKHYLRNNRFNEAFKKYGYDNYDDNLAIAEQYLSRAPKGVHLKEGCREVLDYLSQNYLLHIITNGFKEVQNIKLDGVGLRGYFNHIIISEEYEMVKPDEKIFRLAETLSGAKTGECVMVGDSLESDIAGAINAGWDAVHLADGPPTDNNVKRIKKLEELKSLF